MALLGIWHQSFNFSSQEAIQKNVIGAADIGKEERGEERFHQAAPSHHHNGYTAFCSAHTGGRSSHLSVLYRLYTAVVCTKGAVVMK